MKQEYETGYTMGVIQGGKDSKLLVPPYTNTEGTEWYQMGYSNGYFEGYTKGLSSKIKKDENKELRQLIATRLEEIGNCMNEANKKQKIK